MKLKLFLPLLLITMAISSCKVTFQPTYDAGVLSEIKVGQSLTQKLYETAISNPDKSYAASADMYQMLSAQINSLATKEAARVKSSLQVAQVDQLKKLFNKYENYHKIKGVLNDAEFKLYGTYLDAIWKSLKNAEQNLPK